MGGLALGWVSEWAARQVGGSVGRSVGRWVDGWVGGWVGRWVGQLPKVALMASTVAERVILACSSVRPSVRSFVGPTARRCPSFFARGRGRARFGDQTRHGAIESHVRWCMIKAEELARRGAGFQGSGVRARPGLLNTGVDDTPSASTDPASQTDRAAPDRDPHQARQIGTAARSRVLTLLVCLPSASPQPPKSSQKRVSTLQHELAC